MSATKEAEKALDAGLRLLKKVRVFSNSSERDRDAALFGTTGGIIGAGAALALSIAGLFPIWAGALILPGLGICLGHITIRSLRGFRKQAEFDQRLDSAERAHKAHQDAIADETRRQRALLHETIRIAEKGGAAPEVVQDLWKQMADLHKPRTAHISESPPALGYSATGQPADVLMIELQRLRSAIEQPARLP